VHRHCQGAEHLAAYGPEQQGTDQDVPLGVGDMLKDPRLPTLCSQPRVVEVTSALRW